MDCFKVVFEINIQHPPFTDVLARIADDAPFLARHETMHMRTGPLISLKQSKKVPLQVKKRYSRRADSPSAAAAFRNREFRVSRGRLQSIGDMDHSPPVIPLQMPRDLSEIAETF